jgi:hypothetical protein
MSDLIQLPGVLNIKMLHGDDLSFDVEFNVDLTGFTLSAYVTPAGSTSSNIPITISPVDLVGGKIHLFISRSSVLGLPVNIDSHKWLFSWIAGGFTRGILGGTFTIEEL